MHVLPGFGPRPNGTDGQHDANFDCKQDRIQVQEVNGDDVVKDEFRQSVGDDVKYNGKGAKMTEKRVHGERLYHAMGI